jgi:hypothetical protein
MSAQQGVQGPASPAETLIGLLTIFRLSRAIQLAARLGLADLLRDGPRDAGEMAAATGTDADALGRLLRALAGFGVFASDGKGRFRLTPLSDCLRADAPGGSLRGFALLMDSAESWQSWGNLDHSIRTGRPAFEAAFGETFFTYMSTHPEIARIFDEAMSGRSRAESAAFVAAYDLSFARTVVDVGGGHGTLLAAVLQASPSAHGVLVDLPHVAEGARDAFAEAGLAERCRVEPGDFFASVPEGGDLYLLHKIIHDWDDARAATILARCRAAMGATSRLVLLEAIMPTDDAPHHARLLDLSMMVWPGGRERTEREYRALLASAGLRLTRVVPTATEAVSVIEAVPSAAG